MLLKIYMVRVGSNNKTFIGVFKVQKKIMYTFEHVNKVKQKINKIQINRQR